MNKVRGTLLGAFCGPLRVAEMDGSGRFYKQEEPGWFSNLVKCSGQLNTGGL